MLPAVLGLAGAQINLMVDNKLASHLGDGAISSLQYAIRLFQLPLGVFAVSIAAALLPRLSQHAAAQAWDDLSEVLRRGIRLAIFIILPAMAGLWAIGRPTIELLFQHGRFLPEDTTRTLYALNFYLIGMIGYGLVYLLTRAFYALRDTKTPVLIGIVAVAVNIVLDYTLVGLMGVGGLALATSVAGLVNMALLILSLERRLGRKLIRPLAGELSKMVISAGVMGALAFLFYRWLVGSFDNRFLLVLLPALLGILLYYLLSKLGGFLGVIHEVES